MLSVQGLVPKQESQMAQKGKHKEGPRQTCPQQSPEDLQWGATIGRGVGGKRDEKGGEEEEKSQREAAQVKTQRPRQQDLQCGRIYGLLRSGIPTPCNWSRQAHAWKGKLSWNASAFYQSFPKVSSSWRSTVHIGGTDRCFGRHCDPNERGKKKWPSRGPEDGRGCRKEEKFQHRPSSERLVNRSDFERGERTIYVVTNVSCCWVLSYFDFVHSW